MKKPTRTRASYTLKGFGAVVLSLFFLILSTESMPHRDALESITGTEPGFALKHESFGKNASRSIRFGGNRGIDCVISGPKLGAIERALQPGVIVSILCDPAPVSWQPPLVYEISVDGQVIVTFDEVVSYRKKDKMLGRWASVAMLLIAIWFFWKGRKIATKAA